MNNKPSKPKIPVISGIYKIENMKNHKCYIGSSNNVQRRLQTHKRELDAGSHNNLLLQKEYKEFGASSFSFIILIKDIPSDMLLAYEKCFMYKYDSVVRYKGYNQMFSTVNHKLFKQAYEDLKNKNYFN